jgi:hypothetical protein
MTSSFGVIAQMWLALFLRSLHYGHRGLFVGNCHHKYFVE